MGVFSVYGLFPFTTTIQNKIRAITTDPSFKTVFLKNMKMGTIPVSPGMLNVNVVKTATKIFGIVSDPDLPIIGTNTSKQLQKFIRLSM